MGERYELKFFKRFTLLLSGFPNSGKSVFALAPHPSLGDVAYFPFDQGAESMEGIPQSIYHERLKIYRPGWSDTGVRYKGQGFTKKIIDAFGKKIKEKTIIVDTATAMIRLRYFDELESQGGKTTEYRRENEAPQQLAVHALDTLYNANPDKNIIFLHHLKAIKDGQDFKTWTPDIIGSKLLPIWDGQFSASLVMDTELSRQERKFFLLLKATGEQQKIRFRATIAPDLPSRMDVTLTERRNYEPILLAWDRIFKALDSIMDL